jgi:hypothetical protein
MAVLPRYESLQFTKMLNDKGSGSAVSNLDDEWFETATLALPAPTAPVVIAQGSSDATANVFTADVETAAVQGSAVTVVSSASGSNTPITCVDTEGNIYLNTLAALLSSNPYFEQNGAGSVADWAGFNCTIVPQALSGLPVPYGVLLTVTTAGCACEGSPSKFTITPGASYLVTALVWLPEAGTVVLGADWDSSGGSYVSTSTSSISVEAETWTAIGTVITAPGSGVGKAYPRCGYSTGTGAGTTMQLTALAMQPAASMQVFQALNITALTLNDAISVTYAADDAQQTNLIAVNMTGIQPQTAVDVAVAASGTSAHATASGTPSELGELGLFFVNNAAAGGAPSVPANWSELTQLAGTGRGEAQRMLIGLYSYPPSAFWTAAIDAAPTTGIIIANVDSGPGAGQESNFLAVYQEAAAAGITLVGYVSTNYGAVSQTSLQNQIQQWNDYYGITSIFFDTVNPAADYVDYYQEAVQYVHAQPGGGDAIVVLNPGSPPTQALFGILGENDIIQVCEDTYANFAGDGATAPAYLLDENSANIAITCYDCPNSTDMNTVLGIAASDFNAGWVWVTDGTLPNPYANEPAYFTTEVSALAGTGTTEQYTTVYYSELTSDAAQSPSATITSAAWQAQLLTLEGTGSAPASTLWDNEHLWQVMLDGIVVFEFFAETITEQQVDQSEQRNVTTTGPGTITALSWAAAMPPGFPNIIFKCDAIQDGFAEIDENGNLEVDTSLWNIISPTDMVTLNPSGTLQLTASQDTTYCGATPYDLTESLISAQIAPLGQGTENSTDITVALDGSQVTQFYIQSNANADDYILMGVTAAGIYCQLGDTESGPQTKELGAYNSQTQLYWQMSADYLDADSGAVQVTFWTSADGQTYTPVWVVNPSWVPDNVTVFFACSYDQNNSQVMSITNVNGNVVTPSSSGNIYFGEPIMAVWDSIFTAAQERGTIPFITTALDGATDSFGNPWTDSESVQIENGTDLYSLLQSHTAIVDADYIMQPGFVLQVGLPVEGSITLGVDRSEQVVFREGQWIQQKQYTRDRSQIANLDGGVNSDGTTISASDEDSILEWGQREGWVQTAVQVNPQSMEIAVQASVQQTADEVESYTIQVDPAQPGCRAWKDYNVGDWIGLEAPGPEPGGPDFSANSVSAVRVTAIAISVDATGLVTCQLTLMTYLQWLQEQLQYLVNKMGGQFINSLGTTPVTSSANGVPTQLPTIFAPNINGLNGANVLGTTGIPNGAQLVYNAITGQWQAASSQDPVTGSTLSPTGANLSTLQYSTPQASQGNLIASISNAGGTDPTGNAYLPGVVSYGSTESQTIQLYMGQVAIGQAPGTQIVLNPDADQVFNITTAIAGTLQAIAEFTTNDTNEVLPGVAGSLVLNPGASQKMATALTSPLNANSAACVVLETENDAGTDTPVITFGQVTTPDDSTFVFTPIATLTPWAFLLYGGSGGTVVETIDGPSSGNWPVPATVSVVKAEVWGMAAGAGGSNHGFWTVQAGGGSGGGGYSCEPALAVTPGGNCPYVLPAGGAGGVGSTGSPGGAADATFQGSAATVTAHGGLPGAGAASPGNGQGGDGAAASGNTISYPGGQGATGGYNDGGGGGGAAGTGGPGGGGAINGGGSPGSGGGKGGNGGVSGGPGSGSNGSSPGGGAGGGAGTSASGTVDGGSGGAARARVTYTTGAPDIMASFAAAAGTDQFGNTYPEGTLLAGADAGWTYVGTGGAPGFGSGWSNAGSGNADLAYRMVGAPHNCVLILGYVTNGTAANTASIFTLPTAYRPASQQIFPSVENGGTYGNSVVVETSGAVKMFNSAGTGNYAVFAMVSLDI